LVTQLSPAASSSLEIFWLGFSGIATAGAAITAAVQVWLTRADGKRQAAFEHIRGVEERLRPVLHMSARGARDDVLAFYRRKREDLTPRAADYLTYLTALDLLVFGCETKSVDRKIATTWLRGRLARDDDVLQFIVDLQVACEDPSCLEYLKRHLAQAWHRAITIKPKSGTHS
jgi:hypothetical protein